jgi:hypothetical protein
VSEAFHGELSEEPLNLLITSANSDTICNINIIEIAKAAHLNRLTPEQAVAAAARTAMIPL